jgi:hypothetical protein
MSETPLITRSSSSTDRRMVRGAAKPCPARRQRAATGATGPFGAGRERVDQRAVVAGRHLSPASIAATISPMRSMIASTALTSAVGGAAAGADVGQRILGGVAQRLEPREIRRSRNCP